MKKIIALIAALFVSTSAFAMEFETYVDLSYDQDVNIYNLDSCFPGSNFTNFSQGFNLDITFYALGNLGVYANFGYNFPYGTVSKGGIPTEGFLFDASFGLAFMFNTTETVQVTGAVGLNFGTYDRQNANETKFGLTGVAFDLGARWVPFKYVYFNTGAKGAYNFALSRTDNSNSDDLPNCYSVNIRPYVGVGFIVYENF